MSQESTTPYLVELSRKLLQAGSRGDFDAMVGFLAPDAVFEATALGTSFKGVAAIRGFVEDWLSSYEEYGLEPEEILDLGNGVVFAVTRRNARLSGSVGHARLLEVVVYVLVWVDGIVVRALAYGDVDEARAAAERLAESRG